MSKSLAAQVPSVECMYLLYALQHLSIASGTVNVSLVVTPYYLRNAKPGYFSSVVEFEDVGPECLED